MRHCFNPTCLRPQNPGNSRFCNHCGSQLSLGDRFRGLRNLGRGNQTIFAVDEQMPSRPNCVIQSFQGNGQPYWSDELLLNLEAIGQQQMLPPLMAVLSQPMRNGAQEQPVQFLAQRYTPGESLAQRLQERGPLSEAAIRSLLQDLLPQLERLHRADWVHRDLRPETILVAPRPAPPNQRAGDPIIQTPDRPPEICRLVGYNGMQFNGLTGPTDLSGPLKQAHADTSPLSHELERLGYRAPEQIMGQAIPASDLYSLGVTIIQLLTGQRLPHLLDIQNDHWIWQTYLPQPVSPSLVTIVETLLTRATRHRYSSAQAVLDALNLDPLSATINLSSICTQSDQPIPDTNRFRDQSQTRYQSQTLIQALIDAPETLIIKDLITQIVPQLSPSQQAESNRLLQAIVQAQIPKKITQIQANPTDRTQIELPVGSGTGIAGPISPVVAQAYLDLGDYYRDLSLEYHEQSSDQSSEQPSDQPSAYLISIAIGITAYNQALTSFDISPSAWSDLGQLYDQLNKISLDRNSPTLDAAPFQTDLAQTGLERAIASYHHGLDRISPSEQPRLYIELQRQIGEAHSALAHSLARNGDAIAQWSAAIAAYQLALAQCDAEHQPQTYSLLSNHLGTAYWHLALLDQPIDNLQAAIQHYTAALIHDDPDRDPLRAGLIQNNLGTAYLNLAQQEQSIDLLRLAVGAYQIALIYRRADLAPEAHAASQNNLGTACLQLACHPYCDPQSQREALDQSISAYAIALASNGQGFDQRQARINFALAHEQLGHLSHGGDSNSDDDIAFAHLETALQGYLNSLPDWLPHEPTYPMLSQAVARIADQLLALNLPIDYPLFTQIPEGIWAPGAEPDILAIPGPIPQKSMVQVG